MKKLGILTHQISNSQQYSCIAHNLNIICENNKDVDPIVFYNDLGKVRQNNQFAIMQSVEALDYDGIIIATDTVSAHFLSKCLRAKERYFYVWDVDWNTNQRPLSFAKQTYLNPQTKLIARSQDHAELIGRLFRRPEYVIEEFNHEQVIKNIIHA